MIDLAVSSPTLSQILKGLFMPFMQQIKDMSAKSMHGNRDQLFHSTSLSAPCSAG
jgi:hypothetical protein